MQTVNEASKIIRISMVWLLKLFKPVEGIPNNSIIKILIEFWG